MVQEAQPEIHLLLRKAVLDAPRRRHHEREAVAVEGIGKSGDVYDAQDGRRRRDRG